MEDLELIHLSTLEFGSGDMACGAIKFSTEEHPTVIIYKMDEAKPIGTKLDSKLEGYDEIPTDREIVQLKFSNVESIKVLLYSLQIVKDVMEGTRTFDKASADYESLEKL